MGSLNIALAYFLDLILGDPRWFPHPVRIIGRLINFLEAKLRNSKQRKNLRIRGAILALAVVGLSALSTYLILVLMIRINPIIENAVWIFLAYTSLATKDLFLHAREVSREVKAKNIFEARRKLSLIVGRDTRDLSEEKLIVATVESIAESTNDGIIAPLFYLVLGGPVLAIAYKAINTLDSMIGHKNEKYKDFGWFSARLDDAANFIPARISGLLIAASSSILGKNFKNSLITMIKDGNKHPSPNAGFPEAAMAGALGIRLGGPSAYQGKVIVKPYLGGEKKPVEPSCINEALTVSLVASIFMVFIGVFLKWII